MEVKREENLEDGWRNETPIVGPTYSYIHSCMFLIACVTAYRCRLSMPAYRCYHVKAFRQAGWRTSSKYNLFIGFYTKYRKFDL